MWLDFKLAVSLKLLLLSFCCPLNHTQKIDVLPRAWFSFRCFPVEEEFFLPIVVKYLIIDGCPIIGVFSLLL